MRVTQRNVQLGVPFNFVFSRVRMRMSNVTMIPSAPREIEEVWLIMRAYFGFCAFLRLLKSFITILCLENITLI